MESPWNASLKNAKGFNYLQNSYSFDIQALAIPYEQKTQLIDFDSGTQSRSRRVILPSSVDCTSGACWGKIMKGSEVQHVLCLCGEKSLCFWVVDRIRYEPHFCSICSLISVVVGHWPRLNTLLTHVMRRYEARLFIPLNRLWLLQLLRGLESCLCQQLVVSCCLSIGCQLCIRAAGLSVLLYQAPHLHRNHSQPH